MKKGLQCFELWISGLALALMVAVVVIQVIFRFLGNPFAWPEEIARWTLIWITFAGAGYCFRNGGLIRVDYFTKKFFPPKAQKWIDVAGMGLMTAFFGYLFYSSCMYCIMLVRREQVYPITKVPYLYIVAALVVGSVLSILFSVHYILQRIKTPVDQEAEVEKS